MHRHFDRLFFRNVSTSWMQIAVRVAVVFVLTPLLLETLGQAQYGIWILLTSIIAYFEFADFGFATTLTRVLPERLAVGDYDGISKAISTVFFGFVAILLCLVPPAWILSQFIDRWFEIESSISQDARATLLIIFAVFLIGFERRVFESAIKATERLDRVHWIGVLHNVLYGVAFYVIAVNDGGIVGLAWGLLVVTGVTTLASVVVARYSLNFRLSIGLFDPALLRGMWSSSAHYFLAGIGTLAVFHLDNIVLSAFVGASTVAVYAVAYRFVDMFRLLIGRLTGVLIPRIASLHAVEDRVALRSLARHYIGVTAMVTALTAAGLILYGYDLLGWWVGSENLIDRNVYVVFIGFLILHCLSNGSSDFITALGIHKPRALISLSEAGGNALLSIALVGPWGALGVALASVIVHALGNGWFSHYYLWRYLSSPPSATTVTSTQRIVRSTVAVES